MSFFFGRASVTNNGVCASFAGRVLRGIVGASAYGRAGGIKDMREGRTDATTLARAARQPVGRTLEQARRRRERADDFEDLLAQSLAGRSLAQGIAAVWRAGYTQGWRDYERER